MKKITPFWHSILLSVSIIGAPLFSETPEPNNAEIRTKIERLASLRTEGFRALDTHNYRKAEELFTQALELGVQDWLDEAEVNDILISLARAEVYTKQYVKAESHIEMLFKDHMNEALDYHCQVLRAHIRFGEGKSLQAMILLNELKQKTPLRQWEHVDQKFYLKVKGKVDHYFEDLFTQAERCYEGGLYSETIPLYQEILEGIAEDLFEQKEDSKLSYQVRLRLAYSEFKLGHYAKAQDILLETKKQFPVLFDPDSFLQLIVCAEKLGHYEEALKLAAEFFTYKFSPKKQDAVKYQIGNIRMRQQEIEEAKALFTDLVQNSKNEEIKTKSRFELAKILLREKAYGEVENILHPDHFRFQKDDPARNQWAFLRAQALFARQQYEMALAGYKESQNSCAEQCEWYEDALYGEGVCYLKLAEDRLTQQHSKEEFLNKAENCFFQISQKQASDRVLLGLARTYLLQHYYLKEPKARTKMQALLKLDGFQTIEAELKAGFMFADMTEDENQRNHIYSTLTSQQYQEATNYGKAWYYRGMFMMQRFQKEMNEDYLDQAVELLTQSYQLLKEKSLNQAEPVVIHLAECYLSYNSEEKLVQGYQTLEHLLSRNEVLSENAQRALMSLQAEMCLKLMRYNAKQYLVSGLTAAEKITQLNADPKTQAKAAFIKGRLLFQGASYQDAYDEFERIIENHPQSKYAGESYFWMAECLELNQKDPELSKNYRKKVYTDYPNCHLAPEAYFLTYSSMDYLEGNSEAIEHLKKLEERFGNSPYVIASYYLLGVYYKQGHHDEDGKIIQNKKLSDAIQMFSKAASSFESKYEQHQISTAHLHYFASIYYRALLAKAQCYLEKADGVSGGKRQLFFDQAIDSFEQVYSDFKKDSHPIARLLKADQKYPKVYEEAEFGRALAMAKKGDVESAELAFNAMIEHYHTLQIDKSHYLSRAWYEMANIAMAQGEYQDALAYFNHAEQTCSATHFDANYTIDLGIQQSLCYRNLQQLDMAMLTLSKVINEGVVSNLRVKAMVFRAEIYELQGRRDLAQKQLEAAAKKGGEWSVVAQDKLVKEYGYN